MEKYIVNEKSIQSWWNHFLGKSDSADWETMKHPQETMALFIAKAVLVVVQIFPYQASSRIMPKTLQVWSLILPVAMILTWLHYLIPSWKPIIMGGYASINSYFRVPTNNHNHIGVFFIYPLVNIQKTMENRHFWMAILQLFLWPFSSSQTLLKQIIPWTSPVLLVQSPLPSGNLT